MIREYVGSLVLPRKPARTRPVQGFCFAIGCTQNDPTLKLQPLPQRDAWPSIEEPPWGDSPYQGNIPENILLLMVSHLTLWKPRHAENCELEAFGIVSSAISPYGKQVTHNGLGQSHEKPPWWECYAANPSPWNALSHRTPKEDRFHG